MTLNRGDKLRYLDKRRGSTPLAPPPLHRRSMPVDERDLRAALPPPAALVRCPSYSPGAGQRDSWASDSSDSVISSGSDSDAHLYKVMLLGEHGVGKTSLARIFGGVDDCPDAEEAGEGARDAAGAAGGCGQGAAGRPWLLARETGGQASRLPATRRWAPALPCPARLGPRGCPLRPRAVPSSPLCGACFIPMRCPL